MTDNWTPDKRKHQSKRTVFDMQAEIGRLQAEIERLEYEQEAAIALIDTHRSEIERLQTDNRGYQQDIFHLRGKLNQLERLPDTMEAMRVLAERNELREEVERLRAQRVQWP